MGSKFWAGMFTGLASSLISLGCFPSFSLLLDTMFVQWYLSFLVRSFVLLWVPPQDHLTLFVLHADDSSYSLYFLIWENISGKHYHMFFTLFCNLLGICNFIYLFILHFFLFLFFWVLSNTITFVESMLYLVLFDSNRLFLDLMREFHVELDFWVTLHWMLF